ncbi:MAG: serine/threonine-protein kinase [Isosphaeraceae bacterium]
MSVPCPYCHYTLSLQGAKPGRYSTSCPKCQKKFHLAIPDSPDESPRATPINSEARSGLPGETGSTPTGSPRPGPLPPTLPGTPGAASGTGIGRSAPEAPPTASVAAIPAGTVVGGYQIVKEIGRGGMGTVSLVRQPLWDRRFALKVIRPDWSRDAAYLARLTREVYAAAQLDHPHLVPPLDLGIEKGRAYVALEYVAGISLDRLLMQRGRLDPNEAVGYILQAARGLKACHDQGFVHRDIKPANLLLDDQGLVRVVDLGLTKTPDVAEAEEREAPVPAGSSSAGIPLAPPIGSLPRIHADELGNPAYMAPEQLADPLHIDARADIYGLGCTLHNLLTGRPPYEGRTSAEVIARIQSDPIPSPSTLDAAIPTELSAIVLRMTARNPAERYRDLAEVIGALEAVASTSGPLGPTADEGAVVESSARAAFDGPSARLRRWAIPGFLGFCALLALFGLLLGRPVAVGAFLGLGLMTALADFILAGLRRRTPVFEKARTLAATTPLNEWLLVAAGALVMLAALWAFQLIGIWIFLAIVAVGVALCLNLVVDPRVADEQRVPMEQAAALVAAMRRRGLDESALRYFVATAGAHRWEPLFEALFGFDARLEARRRWGQHTVARPWLQADSARDAIAAWIDARIQAHREGVTQRRLESIEERGLIAQGVNEMTARRKARRAAEAMVTLASEIRASVNQRDDSTIPVNRAIPRSLREAATQPEKVLVDREHGLVDDRRARLVGLLDRVIGPKPRFLAGALLLIGCLAWMHQNNLINAEQARVLQESARRAAEAARNLDTSALSTEAAALAQRAAEDARRAQGVEVTQTLQTRWLPAALAQLVSSFGAGAGGLILILSSFFRGPRMALFAIPAAAIPVVGPALGLPPIGPLDRSVVPAAVGAAVFVAGIFLGRSRT